MTATPDAGDGRDDSAIGTQEGVPLTVAAVAARLGVAASTLRTWDRRYGLGPTAHEAGAHRRYSPDDVARLERMRHFTLQGVAPADAARAAMSADPADLQQAPSLDGAPGPAVPHEPLLVDPLSLAAAAMEPDQPRVQRMLAQEVREKGIVRAWTALARPALSMLGKRDRSDRPGVDPEEMVQAAVLTAVRDVTAQAERGHHARTGAEPRRTVLLCAGHDHRLRAHVIGGALAERGVSARVLRAENAGGADDLLAVLDSRGARVLAVLGHPPGAEELVRAVAERGDIEVFLLGEHPPDVWLPRVRRVRTPTAAVEEIAGILED